MISAISYKFQIMWLKLKKQCKTRGTPPFHITSLGMSSFDLEFMFDMSRQGSPRSRRRGYKMQPSHNDQTDHSSQLHFHNRATACIAVFNYIFWFIWLKRFIHLFLLITKSFHSTSLLFTSLVFFIIKVAESLSVSKKHSLVYTDYNI